MAHITGIHRTVTQDVIAALEAGVRPWNKPWRDAPTPRPRRHSGEPYRGVNILMLWAAAEKRGFASPYWMTFHQAKRLGGHVLKGETGSPVVYADKIVRRESDDEGNQGETAIPFLKAYTVFNTEQIADLPEQYRVNPQNGGEPDRRIEAAERFFRRTGAAIRHGGSQASYAPGSDLIRMPPFDAFKDAEGYYATLAHEAVHWTGRHCRLDRDFGRVYPAAEARAREELVAELGAAFLSADLAIVPAIREDHAPYIASWLKVLNGDRRAIFTAAAHAQRAVDFLNDLQESAG